MHPGNSTTLETLQISTTYVNSWKKKNELSRQMFVTSIGVLSFLKKMTKKFDKLTVTKAFTPAELHYHFTYKEIRAIMKVIKKFKFHLIGHHFLIETDLMSFSQMLKFIQKSIPSAQLL